MPRNDQAVGASQPALEVHTCGPDVEITGIRDFDLDHIFDCGQCFRWNRGGGWQLYRHGLWADRPHGMGSCKAVLRIWAHNAGGFS